MPTMTKKFFITYLALCSLCGLALSGCGIHALCLEWFVLGAFVWLGFPMFYWLGHYDGQKK